MTRQCARPGCSQAAVATLTYDYSGQAAWLDRLSPEPHPMTHDLCDTHALRLSVPQGWRLEDRMMIVPISPPPRPAEQAARDEAARNDAAHDEHASRSIGLFHSQLAG